MQNDKRKKTYASPKITLLSIKKDTLAGFGEDFDGVVFTGLVS